NVDGRTDRHDRPPAAEAAAVAVRQVADDRRDDHREKGPEAQRQPERRSLLGLVHQVEELEGEQDREDRAPVVVAAEPEGGQGQVPSEAERGLDAATGDDGHGTGRRLTAARQPSNGGLLELAWAPSL